MQINKISNSNNSFGRLYLSYGIREKIAHGDSKQFKKDVSSISRVIRQNDLHKRKHVDIILSYDVYGFKAIISSKKEGVPMNPKAVKRIGNPQKEIKSITDWVDTWDYAYSPTGAAEIKKINNFINVILQK